MIRGKGLRFDDDLRNRLLATKRARFSPAELNALVEAARFVVGLESEWRPNHEILVAASNAEQRWRSSHYTKISKDEAKRVRGLATRAQKLAIDLTDFANSELHKRVLPDPPLMEDPSVPLVPLPATQELARELQALATRIEAGSNRRRARGSPPKNFRRAVQLVLLMHAYKQATNRSPSSTREGQFFRFANAVGELAPRPFEVSNEHVVTAFRHFNAIERECKASTSRLPIRGGDRRSKRPSPG